MKVTVVGASVIVAVIIAAVWLLSIWGGNNMFEPNGPRSKPEQKNQFPDV